MRPLILPILLLAGACAPDPSAQTPTRAGVLAGPAAVLPPMKSFTATRADPPARSNREIARDFLDLAFALESGRTLAVFSRFEGPITLRVTGHPPATLQADLGRLLARLRREAGIDITRTHRADASITIEAVPRARIQRHLPGAACFVVPNISALAQYRAARASGAASWSRLTRRERLAIFLPNDASPQEARDCLHEELAQAIGPLNDLYRLPDSVFNDDNVHTVLTGFDMLILRAYYAPELRTGMTRAEVAARLPGILSRLNPGGDRLAPRPASATPRAWIAAIQTALGPDTGLAGRHRAARRAVGIATDRGWRDHRRAFSHLALGRVLRETDPAAALVQFEAAETFYRTSRGTGLHRAYSGAQIAAAALSRGDGARALAHITPHLRTAKRHENAALLANLMLLKAEALEQSGRHDAARAVRLDSLGWARYGFGPDWAGRARGRGRSRTGTGTASNG